MSLLGFEVALDPADDTVGRDLLVDNPEPRTHYFACYYDRRCFGSIDASRKLVILPESQQAFAFDRKSDPREERPVPLEPNDPAIERLRQRLRNGAPILHAPYLAPFATDNGWVCPEHKLCSHPKTPEGLFFKPTSNDGCMVHVSKYSVPKQGKFDLVLKLKNVCNGKAECVLSTDADLTERMLSLKSGEEQTVEMVKGAPTDRFEPRIRCRFE
jgi:hypothetical protein